MECEEARRGATDCSAAFWNDKKRAHQGKDGVKVRSRAEDKTTSKGTGKASSDKNSECNGKPPWRAQRVPETAAQIDPGVKLRPSLPKSKGHPREPSYSHTRTSDVRPLRPCWLR